MDIKGINPKSPANSPTITTGLLLRGGADNNHS